MELKTKVIDTANASVTAKISSEEIKSKLENLAKKAAKNMKMEGFRVGKVPVNLVLKRYEKELTSDAEQDALKDLIDAALKELNRKTDEVIGEPMFIKFEREEGAIDTEIEISFKPVVNLDGYEELIPEFSTPRVMKKEIDEKKDELLKMVAPLEKVDKKKLEKGDFAKFDFEGFVDGVAFDGGKAEGYVLEIGSGQFIPGFEDGMIGLKVGEEKDVEVTFPAEYGAPNLAGKPAVFKVKLHEIQGKNVAKEIDAELLKQLMPNEENASVELLEERIKDQIRADKQYKLVNEELKPKFAEAIVEKYKFDIPKNIVEQEIDMQFRGAWNGFSEDEMKSFRDDKDALTKKRETFREDAQKSVKLTFIIDELARRRNVAVSDQELIQAVYFEAYRSGLDPKQHLENYKNQEVLPAIKMSMIEEKLFNEMFDKKEEKAEKEPKKAAKEKDEPKTEKKTTKKADK
ncbi:trigger factor [Campylobacter sp. RM15925]|uniref:trigger factor n=1 Tax=Campylobacter sp. RM15925 TaxID=1705724 RepID=UPI001474A923|nr:trigger factor [Campylobacter sp. RM15925]